MTVPPLDPGKGYHLVGLGGVGMSALAEYLIGRGCRVSGSDRSLEGPAIAPLERLGVHLFPQDGSGVSPENVLIYSTAIEEDNPDLLAAKAEGMEMLHRAEVIARAAAGMRVVAVSGTAGKTTMTALMAWILTSAGMDPSVINGGILLNWQEPNRLGAARVGKSDWMIVEADESDRSFLRFHPEWAIVSNLARDHFSYEETVTLFRDFAGQCAEGLVVGAGVREALSLDDAEMTVDELRSECVRDGWVQVAGEEITVPLPGIHNAWNAGLVILCCRALGVPMAAIQEGLASFRGVHRRLEKVGRFGELDVFDDYAHNSMKMKAAIETLQARYEEVTVFWRPHGFGPLRMMFEDLTEMFATVLRTSDRLFILPVFYAGGTADTSLDSDQLVDRLQSSSAPVWWAEDYAALGAAVTERAGHPGALLGMGARDPQISEFLKGLV